MLLRVIRWLNMYRGTLLRAGFGLCFVVLATEVGGQQRAVAYVLDVKGEWRLDGGVKSLAAGDGLAAAAKITSVSNRPGDAIAIVRDGDLSRVRVVCDASAGNPCRSPVLVQGESTEGKNGSQLKGVVQAAIAVLLDRPPAIASHYALTLTRGKTSVREMEDVLALDPGTGIVLPPAPADMPAGRYTISMARVGEETGGEKKGLPAAAVLTSEGTWRPMAFAGTGLFEASIASADGGQMADAMLLVIPAAQFGAIRTAFDATKGRTAAWTGPGARADEHLFLRAFLLSASGAP